ncbi:MAG: hypothetical protein WD969_07015 [Paracoccaceae bacterium]
MAKRADGTEEAERLKDERFELLFDLRRSARYHSARRGFFTRWSKLGSFISVLAGGSTIASILAEADPWISISAAAVISIAQAAELVFDLSGKAMRHEGFYRDFVALEQRVELQGDDIDRAQLRELISDRLRLESGEPPILRWLDVLCYNELAGSMGFSGSLKRVSWLQRQLAHLLDMTPVHQGHAPAKPAKSLPGSPPAESVTAAT